MSETESAGHLAERISAGIVALGQRPGQHPIDRYISFLQLLSRWNQAYNLTAITDPEKLVTHHVLDSLSVLPYLHGNYCLDAGTGAGLPGIILALADPDKHWVLLDSTRKKTRFVNQAVMELKLTNVRTECARLEQYRPERLFTTIITRAFGRLSGFYACSKHLLVPEGVLLAMKGGEFAAEIEELQGLKEAPAVIRVHRLAVPGVEKDRCLVEMESSDC